MWWRLWVCVLFGVGCTGVIASDRGQRFDDPQAAGAGDGDGLTGDGDAAATGEPMPSPRPRFARLTHAQWNRSVIDLLGLPADENFTTDLRADPAQSGYVFDNQAAALSVDQALWGAYQRVAGQLAARVTGDPALLALLWPDSGDLDADRDAFIGAFGLRAHRRPLSGEDRLGYQRLFDLAPTLYVGLPDHVAGVRVVVEAALQSPHFLYRTELSTEARDGTVPLDDYEVASRLSYLLWNTMPDDALFAAAADGGLQDAADVADVAAGMLDDPRAAQVIVDFHLQLLDTGRYDTIMPSANFYDVSDRLPEHAREETELFLREIIYGRELGLSGLLTSRETYVNAELATIYGLGLQLDPGTWERVSLDPAQRAGILTQVGFLAANATTVDPDPIHRGKFVAERIACLKINAPPADIPPLPDPAGRTNRQVVEDHTENPDTVCITCHGSLINPFGFPFEAFDAVGAYRTEDRGQPVDTTSDPFIDDERTAVEGAIDLVEKLAESPGVHACYARHFVEYAQGQVATEADAALEAALAEGSLAGGSVRDLLAELVQTRAFLTRATEELP